MEMGFYLKPHQITLHHLLRLKELSFANSFLYLTLSLSLQIILLILSPMNIQLCLYIDTEKVNSRYKQDISQIIEQQ